MTTKPDTETAESTEPTKPAAPVHPRAAMLAPLIFDLYNNTPPNPGKTYDGKPVPPWSKVSDQVRAKWTGVAQQLVQNEVHAYNVGHREGALKILRPLIVLVLLAVVVGLSALTAVLVR